MSADSAIRISASFTSVMRARAIDGLRRAYQRSLAMTSASASGRSLTTRAGTLDVEDGPLDAAPWAAIHLVRLEAVQSPVDLLGPGRLGIRIRVRVEAHHQPAGKVRPLLLRKLQRLVQEV